MLLELISVNIKREPKSKKGKKKKSSLWKRWNKGRFSYLWVAEAQMERQEKFGGAGDIHYHLITDAYIPIKWLNAEWCRLVGAYSPGCVHVDHVPAQVHSIPNYLAKYFGKGTQRKILSRRFSCTRNLSGAAPVKLKGLPENATLLKHRTYLTKQGFEVNYYYYDTGEVMANYLHLMADEAKFRNASQSGPKFTPSEIAFRRQKREHKQKSKLLNPLFHDQI